VVADDTARERTAAAATPRTADIVWLIAAPAFLCGRSRAARAVAGRRPGAARVRAATGSTEALPSLSASDTPSLGRGDAPPPARVARAECSACRISA